MCMYGCSFCRQGCWDAATQAACRITKVQFEHPHTFSTHTHTHPSSFTSAGQTLEVIKPHISLLLYEHRCNPELRFFKCCYLRYMCFFCTRHNKDILPAIGTGALCGVNDNLGIVSICCTPRGTAALYNANTKTWQSHMIVPSSAFILHLRTYIQ